MQTDTKYWFPAKRYGWGWGLPRTWQGWVVFAGFVGLMVVGAVLFPPSRSLAVYLLYVAVLCALFVAVVWFKGEPPHWRWGDDAR